MKFELWSWLRKSSSMVKLKNAVVTDCPLELEECESCRELECKQSKWESCPRRLCALKASKADKENHV